MLAGKESIEGTESSRETASAGERPHCLEANGGHAQAHADARETRSSTTLSSHSNSKSSLSHRPRCGSVLNFRGGVDIEGSKFGSNWLDRCMEDSVQQSWGCFL